MISRGNTQNVKIDFDGGRSLRVFFDVVGFTTVKDVWARLGTALSESDEAVVILTVGTLAIVRAECLHLVSCAK